MRYAALLRGVNVGRAKRVAMADLRSVVADLGYCNVRTLLQSGNVVFDDEHALGPPAAAALSGALEQRTGVSAGVLVLESSELQRVGVENPLAEEGRDPARLQVAFLLRPSQDRDSLRPLLAREWGRERIALGSRAVYLWCPEGTIRSPLAIAVGKLLGERVTTRNWRTVGKLLALCA